MADDHRFDWRASLPDRAWGAHRHGAQWLVDHVPMDRLFAAFEDENAVQPEGDCVGTAKGPVRVPDLFSLCARAVVPFAVINAALQARLPMLVGNLDAPGPSSRAPSSPPEARTPDVDRHDGGNDNSGGDDGRGWCDRPWWVSRCACAADNPCERAVDCARARLARIDTRAAMRILAWHWVDLIHERLVRAPCKFPTRATADADLIGLNQQSWEVVTGQTALEEPPSGRGRLCLFSGPVFWVEWTHEAPGDATLVPRGAAVPHPYSDALCAHYHVERSTYVYGGVTFGQIQDWSAVAWVRGDPAFTVRVFS
ncbi:hypothetical protein [Pandoravirus japonicus]|uniref:Uncharacterized protein n=1 Tax=Pandoravirus japonicus TaxID=2823154 RepID=A0A811BNT6_9VIRU|nr:hypothetical protein [Pandoravirus japonicus]